MSTALARPPATTIDYETDFAAWAEEQARSIENGQWHRVDRANVVEELRGLARSDRNEIESRLVVLLLHLLKHQAQPAERSRSWLASILEQRRRIARIVQQSPSLRGLPRSVLGELYPDARRAAAVETGLPLDRFPAECPFRIEDVLDADFLPGPATSPEAPDDAQSAHDAPDASEAP